MKFHYKQEKVFRATQQVTESKDLRFTDGSETNAQERVNNAVEVANNYNTDDRYSYRARLISVDY
jgi:hypothetical protein